MCVPDFELICEIMLVAEGFQEARVLARKFITLYTLCKELLSKQDHYDWGLRAIKSVLVVAGSLKVIMKLIPLQILNCTKPGILFFSLEDIDTNWTAVFISFFSSIGIAKLNIGHFIFISIHPYMTLLQHIGTINLH